MTQVFYDDQKSRTPYSEPMVFRPEIIKAADFGLHNAASDLMWLNSIQYFGGGESRTNEKLKDYLFLASDLDPKFAYPYAFGTLILPSIKEADEGLKLGQKGIDNRVNDWRIPYYMATVYHLEKNDPANAAKYFDIAASTPNVPEGIKKVASNYGSRTDLREKTKQIWIGIYDSSNDDIVKERAKNYILHFEIMDLLDGAATQYKKLNGKYPASVNDLVSGRILKAIPKDPFGFEYYIDEEGHAKVKYN